MINVNNLNIASNNLDRALETAADRPTMAETYGQTSSQLIKYKHLKKCARIVKCTLSPKITLITLARFHGLYTGHVMCALR